MEIPERLLEVPVRLTHCGETKYVFPVEVVLVKSAAGHYNLSLARNRMTYVRVVNDCLYLNGGPDSVGAHFEIKVHSDAEERESDANEDEQHPAILCSFRVKNIESGSSHLGVGFNSEEAGGYGGKYGDVADSQQCIGGAGPESQWFVERCALPSVPQASQLIQAWDENMRLTSEQKHSFMEQGYLLVPNGVPLALCDAAREVPFCALNNI